MCRVYCISLSNAICNFKAQICSKQKCRSPRGPINIQGRQIAVRSSDQFYHQRYKLRLYSQNSTVVIVNRFCIVYRMTISTQYTCIVLVLHMSWINVPYCICLWFIHCFHSFMLFMFCLACACSVELLDLCMAEQLGAECNSGGTELLTTAGSMHG